MLKKLMFITLCATIGLGCCNDAFAQKKGKKGAPQPVAAVKDTTAKKAKGPMSIDKFIKSDAKIMKGLTTVYQQDGKFFLNINDSLIGKDLVMVSRLHKGAEGVRSDFDGYAGDELANGVFRFEKNPLNNQIFLTSVTFRERSSEIMPESVEMSNRPAIVAVFDIKAQSADKKDNIIDMSNALIADSEYLFFRKYHKITMKLGNLQKDKSFVSDIKTYPMNTEIKVVQTYDRKMGNPTATFEMNCSFVLLPKDPMTPRYADSRVGYFTESYTDFDRHPQKVERTSMISRWRLEPKPEDVEKYKRGELVEPAKPIVFYIDPNTPKEWVPYLIQGVNDWQVAFEQAGFKNAIYALEAPTPEEDPTWSIEDARYSAIVYKPSSTPNASGPHVSDPRTGEILESHINWYHNVMSLLSKWYFIQCSPSDPAARKMTIDTELMGELVRFVSSHEVGHTLGLRHNFIGSAIYNPDDLRNPEFLKEHGHATSIMDYARFNYVAQPEDNIPRNLLFPKINYYDKWAIEWGYRRFPDIDDPVKELPMLNKWIVEKTQDPRLLFGTENSMNDPRLQSEDLSNNHMVSNEYGVKNLKFIMDHLVEWTSEPGKGYTNLKDYYKEVLSQYKRYMNHVIKWVGGVYEENKTIEQPGAIYTHVEKSKQKEAMEFLKRNLLTPQEWLFPEEVLDKINTRADATIDNIFKSTLKKLLGNGKMENMINDEFLNGSDAYTLENFYNDINSTIWVPIPADKSKAIYQRMIQKNFVLYMIGLAEGQNNSANGFIVITDGAHTDNTDVTAMAIYQLKNLKKKLEGTKSNNATNAAHYQYLVDLINKALTKNTVAVSK